MQLEEIVFPVLRRLVSSEGQDVLEEVMELLAYFTYYTPTLSPAMWSLWPQVDALLKPWHTHHALLALKFT